MISTAIVCRRRFRYLREVGELSDTDVIGLSHDPYPYTDDYNIVINWGVYDKNGKNSTGAIQCSSNKPNMRRMWISEGLDTVPVVNSESEISYPAVARPSYHQGGKEFYLFMNEDHIIDGVNTRQLYASGYYVSPYIEKDREYRVHVMDGAVLFVQEKSRESGEKIMGNWNHTNGYIFRHLRWGDINGELTKMAIDAVRVAGLWFGAVDIMQKGDQYFLLEINTAPRLQGRSIQIYAHAINFLRQIDKRLVQNHIGIFTWRGEDE